MSFLIHKFESASRTLKFPSIHFHLESGEPIQLLWAGSGSKHPGTINITNGAPFGRNEWYGRIMQDGAIKWAHIWVRQDPDLLELIESALAQIPNVENGKCCIYCNRPHLQHGRHAHDKCASHWQWQTNANQLTLQLFQDQQQS